MTGAIWQGKQWQVTADGLDEIADAGGVELSILDLSDGEPARSIVAHMAGKPWVDFDEFVRAFLIACVVHHVDLPNVGAIVDYGFRVRRSAGLLPQGRTSS